MKVYSGSEIRNVAILGHSGSGKTTIVESALFASGVTNRMGKVDDGNTVSDYEAEEVRRKVSINASIIPIEWLNNKINFIDTPGYFDYIGEVKQALHACDLVLIIVSAKSGIEVGTELAWEYATELGLPKMFFVNGMDDENADFDNVVQQLKDKFGKSVAPVQVPIRDGGKFAGFINVIRGEAFKYTNGKQQKCDVPSENEESANNMHLMIEEAVAETDDTLMEKFFNEERFTYDEIHDGILAGVKTADVSPVLCGCATQSIGIDTLMNFIVKFMPPTSELHSVVKAKSVKTNEEVQIKCDDKEPFSAFVFKTIADPYVGRLSIFRVMSGVCKKETVLYNTKHDFVEKAAHIYVLRGKEQIEVTELKAGDIGAIAKLQHTATCDTLCAKENPILFNDIEFPPSLYSMAIMPKGKGDEDKIGQALSKLLEEDKTLSFEVNKETKQSVVSGIGDSQLDVLIHKLKAKYKLEADLESPIVPYREMIKGKIKVQGKYKKQSGGHGQYGDVHIEFEPSSDIGSDYVFEEKIFGGAVPRQYFPAVEKGIQECVKAGPLAGYPVVGIKATLVDGSYHAVDSSEMAFKMATIQAFKEGFIKAKPTLLEPIAKVEVLVPDDYTGDIMGDMNKRRGRILGMDKVNGKQKIAAEVPMSEIFKYSIELRAMTQGRGSYTMNFERYEEAPMEVQQKVIELRKKELE